MSRRQLIHVPALILLVVMAQGASAAEPSVVVRDASPMKLPGISNKKLDAYVDCNSPSHWDGDTMYIFSSAGQPFRAEGPDLFHLSKESQRTTYDNQKGPDGKVFNGGRWIECTHKAEDGKLYGWYHNEPGGLCPGTTLTAPRIGAVVSTDNGMNWKDLGIVLKAPDDSLFCGTPNRYFAGGNGDFSMMVDAKKEYVYFLIGTYHKDPNEQGVSIARMRYADRDEPTGKVFKWHDDKWQEPGLGGHVTPIFPATIDWHKPNADVFWGPSIHWNTHLKQYVILLNRAKDKDWAQEGIYVTFNPDVADPRGWSKPVRIVKPDQLEESKWYPQVVGLNAAAKETDKLSGQVARLFVAGRSKWELVFLRPGEKAPESKPADAR
jgi:hypothetical protein